MNGVNALFELVGCLLAWHNTAKLALQPGPPQGVSRPMLAWSAIWAVECVPYYVTHGDFASAWIASGRCMALAAWSAIALRRCRP